MRRLRRASALGPTVSVTPYVARFIKADLRGTSAVGLPAITMISVGHVAQVTTQEVILEISRIAWRQRKREVTTRFSLQGTTPKKRKATVPRKPRGRTRSSGSAWGSASGGMMVCLGWRGKCRLGFRGHSTAVGGGLESLIVEVKTVKPVQGNHTLQVHNAFC